MTQSKTRGASKPLQASGRFCVELIRSSMGFGLTLSGGRDTGGDAPLAVRGLLKDGPAQRCGRLQVNNEAPSIQECQPSPFVGVLSILTFLERFLPCTLAAWRPRAPHQWRVNAGAHPCPGRGEDSCKRPAALSGAKQAS